MTSDTLRSAAGDDEVDAQLAELADLVAAVARDLAQRPDDDVVPLTATEAAVLRCVDRLPSASPGRVAANLGLQRSNLSAALRSLEGKGLVDRGNAPHDRRAVELRVTDSGHRSAQAIRRSWSERVRSALDGDTADVDAAVRLLARLEDGLRPHAARGPRTGGSVTPRSDEP